MELLYGTTNLAKLESMRRVTKILGLEIIGLNDLKNCPEFYNVKFPEIDETGSNPLENATLKAKAYFNTLKIPVFSCDSGLYFDEVDEKNQPGTHVRRVNGKELSDLQMIEHYGNLAKSYGGRLTAKYKNAKARAFRTDANMDLANLWVDENANEFMLAPRSITTIVFDL